MSMVKIILWIYESEESIEYYANNGKVRGDGIDRINNDDQETLTEARFVFVALSLTPQLDNVTRG